MPWRRDARGPRAPRVHAEVAENGPGRGGSAAAGRAQTAGPQTLKARRALLGLYGLLGLSIATWLSRLPAVRTDLGLSTGALGSVLLVGSLGSLLMVLVAGGVVARWGSRRSMMAAAYAFTVASVLLGLGPTLGSVPVLLVGVVLMSMSFALGNVPLNLESVVIERAMGRTVVPQFHAAFSVGSVVGSGLGALAAWGHLPLLVHFSAIGALSLAWRWHSVPISVLPLAVPAVPAVPTGVVAGPGRRGGAARQALAAWREPRTLLLGLVVMAGALSEGTANGWLAIAVVDGFARTEALAAVVFGVFVASMTTSRLAGTRVIDRFGRWPVLMASSSLALIGLVLFGIAPSLPVAVLGVVAWGLGSGLVFPIAMAVVAGDGLGAAGRVAVVSAFASVAGLAAPPVIGLAAEQIGIRHAILLIAAAMVLGLLVTRALRGTISAASATLPRAEGAEGAVGPEGADGAGATGSAVAPRPRGAVLAGASADLR